MNKKVSHERGQALVLIVLAITGLLGITGLIVDGGAAYTDRRHAQNAADTAALGAALKYVRDGDWSSAELAGYERAASNGYNNNQTTNTVHVHCPPEGGKYNGNPEFVQVIIETSTPTYFAKLLGINQVANKVEAVSHARPSEPSPVNKGNAMVSLKPNGRGAFRSHGTNETIVYGGGVFVNSNNDCAFEQVGNSVMTVPVGINIVGGACLNGSVSPADTILTGASPIPEEPVVLPPEPFCEQDAVQKDNYLTPGNWVGTFPPSGVIALKSGLYCVDGTFMLNAHDTLIGKSVVIYMRSGNIHWDGGAQINLSAPTTGPFAGLLIYMPLSNDEGVIINGNSDSTFIGTILAPASDIQVNGTASTEGYHSQIIGYTIDLIGTANLVVQYNEEENFIGIQPPEIQLVK